MKRTEETQKKFQEFVETLKGKSEQELKDIEQEVIKEADDYDAELQSKQFKLPKKDFDTVAKAVQKFLDRQTVQWSYTLGCITMYEFWNEYHDKISYAMLDSTLRTLGGFQFTGYKEWKDVIAINEYFSQLREEYSAATDNIYFIADKHSAVMDALKLYEPQPEAEDKVQAE